MHAPPAAQPLLTHGADSWRGLAGNGVLHVVAGIEVGGALLSSNGGASWRDTSKGGLYEDVHSCRVDPWDPSRWYAVTGAQGWLSRRLPLAATRQVIGAQGSEGLLHCTERNSSAWGAASGCSTGTLKRPVPGGRR